MIHKVTRRKFKITHDELSYLTYNAMIKHENIPENCPTLKKIGIDEPLLGFIVVYCEDEAGKVYEVLVLQKFKSSLSVMANREHVQGLKIKYEKDLSFLEID